MKIKKIMQGWVLIVILVLTGCASPATATLQAPTAVPAATASKTEKEPAPTTVTATAAAIETAQEEKTVARAENWNDATHGKDVEPVYTVVFPQDAVNRIDITIGAEEWSALLAEMTESFGTQGDGASVDAGNVGNPPMQNGLQPPATGAAPQMPEGGALPPNGGMQGGQGQGMMDIGGETSYVSTTVAFNGLIWQSVGLRFSGNSTLASSWRSGTLKLSFRLDFDEFEDADPATTDQRFYGFKQLSFKSNAMDNSYLREKVAADVFSMAGVITSKTAFYEVYVDYGEGSQYFGLYTAVEVVDDTVIETQFTEDDGNVYKPEGIGASFAAGTFSEASFEKQTNEDEADWSDIQAVFTALHAETRTSDPAAWRAGLEAVFDVDAFLRWLAADTIMQNWDTYGSAAHNYYLYTNPTTGQVTWIPWDNNMSLNGSRGPGGKGQGGGNGGGRGGMGSVRELDLTAVTNQWPLIRYLADDAVYLAKYRQYLQETVGSVFTPEKMAATYQNYHDLIAPYVAREETGHTQLNSMDAFETALDELIKQASERANAVTAYLNMSN